MPEFVRVARVDDVPPGTLKAVQAGGTFIALANVESAVYAVSDECTHQYCSLSDGDLEGYNLICPCHGAEFDVRTGEVKRPPAVVPVPTYEAKVEDGEVLVKV